MLLILDKFSRVRKKVDDAQRRIRFIIRHRTPGLGLFSGSLWKQEKKCKDTKEKGEDMVRTADSEIFSFAKDKLKSFKQFLNTHLALIRL